MARTRNIKPGFFQNEGLADLPPLARILFSGLWCWADRDGRLEDRPRRLKAAILPYDDVDPDELLQLLHNSPERFIERYEFDGSKYIQITKFGEHQNPHCKEQPSTIPAPFLHHTSTIQEQEHSGEDKEVRTRRKEEGGKKGSVRGESIPVTDGDGSVRHDDGALRSVCDFDRFWEAYPKKVGKAKAKEEFARAVKLLKQDLRFQEQDPAEYLVAKAAEFAQTPKGLAGQYCPHPGTWLHQARYDDDPKTWQERASQNGQSNSDQSGRYRTGQYAGQDRHYRPKEKASDDGPPLSGDGTPTAG